MSDILEIRIVNWAKYQHRKSHNGGVPWVKLHTRILDSHDVQSLTNSAFRTFISLLCMVGRNGTAEGVLRTSMDRVRTATGQRRDRARAALGQLMANGLLTYQEVTDRNCALEKSREEKSRVECDTSSLGFVASEKPPESSSVDLFVSLFQEHAHGPLKPKTVLLLSPRERQKALALLTQNSDPEYWRQVMQRAEQSPFLCGKTSKPFRFTMAFLLQPHTHLKIMNGDYDEHRVERKDYSDLNAAFRKALEAER